MPFVLVSPYARPHYVSHVVEDHTSILRFIETRFDLPALTARDANADPMLDLFDFDQPAFLTPPTLPPAAIDPAGAAQCAGTP
jgi:phospholipase C